MDSNRKFIDFRELLSNEIVDGGQVVVILCGNVRKGEALINSPKITDPSKLLMHVGVNDIDDQYPEDIANNLVTIAKKFQEKFKCNVYLSDITPQNDHFQGHVQAANQTLSYKISKSNRSVITICHRIICMMIDTSRETDQLAKRFQEWNSYVVIFIVP